MKIVLVGAGGGGSAASTAGMVEYTTASNTHTFTVPASVNEIETTLVSAGGDGGQTTLFDLTSHYRPSKGGTLSS